MKKSVSKSQHGETGWATLELVMLLPLIIGLIGVVFYFGQLAFLRLHLTSVVDAAARVASIEDCQTGREFVHGSFSSSEVPMTVDCDEGEHVKLTVTTEYQSSMPFFESITRPVKVTAIVLNEKQWEAEE